MARADSFERQIAEACTHQFQHLAVQGLDHAPHLTVAPFGNCQFEKGVGTQVAQALDARRTRRAIIQFNALAQLLQLLVAEQRRAFDTIGLGYVVRGVGESFGQQGVVGKQQQPAGIFIEAADRTHKSWDILQQIIDRGSPLGIALTGDVALWLKEQNVEPRERLDAPSVEFHAVAFEVDPVFWVFDNAAVYLDAAIMNPRAGIGAGAEPGFRQDTFESLENGFHGFPQASSSKLASMRTVLITGASKGIGAATAECFFAEKSRLLLHYSSDGVGAEAVAQRAREAGCDAVTIQADLTSFAGVEAFCERIRGEAVDVLINNAGSLIGRHKIPDMPAAHWEATVMLNLSSVFYITQAVVPGMIERRRGWIVNVGSVAGRNGGGPGAAAYATCKGAVSALTKSMTKELAPQGIRVNCVAPGVITTHFHEVFSTPQMLAAFKANTPAGRLGTSEETADVIYYLTTDASAYIHGQTIEVNGGMYFA